MSEAKKHSPSLGIDVNNNNTGTNKSQNCQSFSNEEQPLLPTKPLNSLPNHQYLTTNNNFGKSECNDVQLSLKDTVYAQANLQFFGSSGCSLQSAW